MRRTEYSPLEIPNYGMVDAARYLHVPHSTLQFWTSGRDPIMELAHATRPPMLSFKNLVECYVVQGIRTIHKVRLPKIRRAAAWMRAHLPSRHPLADYDLESDGVDLFLEIDRTLFNLSLSGNAAFRPMLEAHLRRVERNAAGMAERLFPYKTLAQMNMAEDAPRFIVIDPLVSFGRPILKDSGIASSVLAGRFKAGDDYSVLARSYGLEEAQVKEAVEWEIGRAA